MTATIEVAKDFSPTPGGRYISDGPYSGELFRDRVLAPALYKALAEGSTVVVVLDGPRGYLSSFLEEAFGGLVRERGFSKSKLGRHLEIRANDPFYETYRVLAQRYIAEAREKALAS
jgi:STAS-like domain of unknown function (DUF4325)